jgi:hypothetical protein
LSGPEVNGLSDTGVRIEMERKHAQAMAHAVTLCWWKKSPEDFLAHRRNVAGQRSGAWPG